MKKIKFTLKIVLMSAVSLLLLTSIVISTMLGSVNAALFKSLSKKLTFEAAPDLMLKYYLDDKDAAETGVYKNSKSISQDFQFTAANGIGVRYHIAIPVFEEGYYTLKFGVEFSGGNEYTGDLNNPVGCKVISADSTYFFGSNAAFRISSETRIDNNPSLTAAQANAYNFQNKPYFTASDNYQWRTVAPGRMEYVELTFYVNSTDVDTNKYVLWMWDFHGLPAATGYTLNLTEISWEKDYSVETQSGPYLDFANMTYKNMSIMPTANSSISTGKTSENKPTRHNTTYVKGHNTAGLTRETGGRGTYVTNATANSLLMQVEPVYYAWRTANVTAKNDKGNNYTLYENHPWIGSEDEDIERYLNNGVNYDYSNPIVLNVPVKNVEAGKTYKVVFDFSIAKQGTTTIEDKMSTANTGAEFADYHSDLTKFFSSDKGGDLHFQSYFYKERVTGYGIETTHAQVLTRGYYSYANKYKNTHWLTNYNNLTRGSSNSLANAMSTHVKSSVNDISWLNAYTHEEINGENKITWLTLENTSFSFNIQGYNELKNGKYVPNKNITTADLQNLQWVWAIDMFASTAWYRFKIDNVRFEEIVDYGANIGNSNTAGIKIGNYEVTNATVSLNNTSMPYRGSSGSGQNFIVRPYTGAEVPALHIYSPEYDLIDWDKSVPSTSEDYVQNRERIYLSGWCVVDGGVDKYVWSADGGKTWPDMKSEGSWGREIVASDIARQATQKINPCMNGTSFVTQPDTFATVNGNGPIDFNNADDGLNADFRGYKIYADLSDYQYEHNLNIIFAAVPASNPNARCEILRIKNYNYTRNYRTYTDGLESDISVSSGEILNAVYDAGSGESKVSFTTFKSIQVGGSCSSAGGYARRADFSKKYEDIRTIYTAIPVKTTLKFTGWAMVDGGIHKYMWSADYGKTWNDFSEDQITLSDNNFTTNTAMASQRKNWFDGISTTDSAFNKNGIFALSVPLGEYVGQVVDVIVAVKPNQSYALCPVGRVDNVAVYGENNSFYTKLLNVTIGGSTVTPTYLGVDGKPLNMVSKNTTTGITAQWDIGYGADNGEDFAYTMFEPYNVNVLNTRMYTNTVQNVTNGTQFSLRGYVACTGGVESYMYTLNGGETWTPISRADSYSLHESGITNARKTDSTFTDDDFSNGNFSSTSGGANLEFTLSSNASSGEEKTLLVVAKSTTGKLYPVFSVRVKFGS